MALFAVATTPTLVLAADLEHYNLDSLVYLSDRIVEGEIIGSRSLGVSVVDVKISRNLAGIGRPGETIAVALTDLFRKSIGSQEKTTPLTKGDRLFLFLIPARPREGFSVPGDGSVLMPVPSGLKLVVGGKALPFFQWRNPGGYIAQLPVPGRLAPGEDVTQLRAAIADSWKRALVWHEQFKDAPISGEAAKLLMLLRERRQTLSTFPSLQDAIVETATWRLARLRNPKLMLQVLSIGWSSRRQYGAVIAGLGTPEGREVVLQRIGDASAPIAERRELARLTASVGLIYHWYAEIDSGDNVRFKSSIDRDNSSYITRIVRLSATVADEEIALALLSGIRSTGFSPGLPQVEVDLEKATTELIKFHRATRSARVRFAIESLISQRRATDFARLQIRSTPVLSLATLDTVETSKVPGTIFVNREETWLRDSDPLTSVALVLEAIDGGHTHVVPVVSDKLQRDKAGRGVSRGDRFQVPPGIRHGKYRVFFRYMAGNVVAAESYSFETFL